MIPLKKGRLLPQRHEGAKIYKQLLKIFDVFVSALSISYCQV